MLIAFQVLAMTWLLFTSVTTFQAGLDERDLSSGWTAILVLFVISLNILLAGFVLGAWQS